jgi:hypothetical protein
MAKTKKSVTRYRDTKTGRWVSKSTWKRSKAQGGTRYKREIPKKRKEGSGGTLPPPAKPFIPWLVLVRYEPKNLHNHVIADLVIWDVADATPERLEETARGWFSRHDVDKMWLSSFVGRPDTEVVRGPKNEDAKDHIDIRLRRFRRGKRA